MIWEPTIADAVCPIAGEHVPTMHVIVAADLSVKRSPLQTVAETVWGLITVSSLSAGATHRHTPLPTLDSAHSPPAARLFSPFYFNS